MSSCTGWVFTRQLHWRIVLLAIGTAILGVHTGLLVLLGLAKTCCIVGRHPSILQVCCLVGDCRCIGGQLLCVVGDSPSSQVSRDLTINLSDLYSGGGNDFPPSQGMLRCQVLPCNGVCSRIHVTSTSGVATSTGRLAGRRGRGALGHVKYFWGHPCSVAPVIGTAEAPYVAIYLGRRH